MPSALKVRLGRRLRWLARFGPRIAFGLPVTPCRNSGQPKSVWLNSIKRHIWFRPWETDSAVFHQIFCNEQYLVALDQRPKVIVDAGANVGYASLYYAAKFPDAKIIAIEPSQASLHILRLNLAGLPNITIVEAALWPTSEEVRFEEKLGDAWGAHVSEAGRVKVAGISLEDLIAQQGLERIDILKIDIEGAERGIFAHGADRWLGKVGLIQIELHDNLQPGCAAAFYRAIAPRNFSQKISGEVVNIAFSP